jgi:diguanylate cyclase (GGDEF)-like protein
MESFDEAIQKLKRKYLRLAEDRLRGIEHALYLLESNPGDGDALKDLEHFFHSLAGSGKTYGFPEATEIGQCGEETVVALIRTSASPSPEILDELRDLLGRLRAELITDGGPAAAGPEAGETLAAPSPMTHLLTHGAFMEVASAVLSNKRRKREASPVLVMLVIDGLKQINRRYGHSAGDEVLADLARLLRQRLRSSDSIGRYRGDEFGLILQDLPEEEAMELLARLLSEFAAIEHHVPDGSCFSATFSAGAASLDREKMGVEQWILAADGALEAARAIGPNRLIAASSLEGGLEPVAESLRSDLEEAVDAIGNARVLLVDDDESILDAFGAFLTDSGLRVVPARSGEEALEKLKSYVPEIIIADVKMPEMDGYEFCRRARAAGHDAIPFLFCSRFGSLAERIAGLRMGADDYMVKPIIPEELVLKTRRLIEKSRQLHGLRKKIEARGDAVVMAGELGEIGVPELLQIFDLHARGDVCLHLESPGRPGGEIYLSGRTLVHAAMGPMSGEKAFYRLLALEKGSFRAEKKSHAGAPTLDLSLQESLLKAAAHLDEYQLMRDTLGKQGTNVIVRYSPALGTSRLEESTRTVVAVIEKHHEIDKILDASPLTDLITLRIILQLLQVGVLGFPMANWWVAEEAQGSDPV